MELFGGAAAVDITWSQSKVLNRNSFFSEILTQFSYLYCFLVCFSSNQHETPSCHNKDIGCIFFPKHKEKEERDV